MKIEISYADGTKRTVIVADDKILSLAVEQADYEDMVARETAKKTPASVKVAP